MSRISICEAAELANKREELFLENAEVKPHMEGSGGTPLREAAKTELREQVANCSQRDDLDEAKVFTHGGT
ncbi:hypothetical protein H920_18751 [Fukomys damarensis]|uniref:Uncharacterized protein n=1 Tax=Fukomys damarensis TaxID=885580 RepID=A0A091CM65_FUKDA|nr:hypothetical protein H920_18751 [Fukomys damarensis]